MNELKVTLHIKLDADVVEDELNAGYTPAQIIDKVEDHLESAIGKSTVDGWQFIQDFTVSEIKEVTNETQG